MPRIIVIGSGSSTVRRKGVVLGCLAMIASGCGELGVRQVDIAYFRFPDSAASQVRQVTRAEFAVADRWIVDSASVTLVPGADDAEAIGELTYVVRLPDERFVAADGLGSELFVLSRDGAIEDVWGRKGAGPGELQYPLWIGFCAEEGIHVYDVELQTITGFLNDGSLASSTRLLIPPNSSFAYDHPVCNPEGYLGVFGDLQFPAEISGSLYRPFGRLLLAQPGGELETLLEIGGPDRYRTPQQDGELGDFARKPLLAMSGTYLFVTTGDEFEIAAFSLDGRLRTLIRSPDVRRARITHADIARVVEEQLEANRNAPQAVRARLRRTLQRMDWPAFHPMVEALVADGASCVWVKHRQVPGLGADWWVLTGEGEPVATARTPPGFTLLQVDGSDLIGIREDEDGVKRVATYRYHGRADGACAG